MKESEIYKYVLVATIKELITDAEYGRVDEDEVYEIVSTVCDKTGVALFCEREAEEADNA